MLAGSSERKMLIPPAIPHIPQFGDVFDQARIKQHVCNKTKQSVGD